jgi:hypothetical protein
MCAVKRIFRGFLITSTFFMSLAFSANASYSDYVNSPMTDHVRHFEKFFQFYTPDHFVELGLGTGTQYFLGKCKKVVSIELAVDANSVAWLKKCQSYYKNNNRWSCYNLDLQNQQILMNGQVAAHQKDDPTKIEGYLQEVDALTEEILSISQSALLTSQIDIIFVDCGFAPRADLVNSLFNKVPIIVAHDTNLSNRFAHGYGWTRIQHPRNYSKVHFSEGQGLTFYIHESKKELIEALRSLTP